MPKIGQEPARRAALLKATINEIGLAGSLDVTVGQIAKRAGMSTALAHYYFESKDAIFLAAMRHILSEFARLVHEEMAGTQTHAEKLEAIVDASLGKEQFADDVVTAWLVFYVQAQHSSEAARLLKIYVRRLHSNLVHCLRGFVSRAQAQEIAQGTAALIDGIYIRHALQNAAPTRVEARRMVKDYLQMSLHQHGITLNTRH